MSMLAADEPRSLCWTDMLIKATTMCSVESRRLKKTKQSEYQCIEMKLEKKLKAQGTHPNVIRHT